MGKSQEKQEVSLKAAQSHRDLIVWQKAMDLVVKVYEHSRQFPPSEAYNLTAQINRSVVSVPANIAEGNARSTARDYGYFLAVAKGSLMETETYLLLALRLQYVRSDDVASTMDLITELSKMLTVMRARLTR